MPLIFENPANDTQRLFARLQACVSHGIGKNVRIQIHGTGAFYSLSVRAHRTWHYVGTPDELVEAFTEWLKARR
jgi:hypothetical protein